MDALATPWANARVAHLLSVCRVMTMESEYWLEGKILYE